MKNHFVLLLVLTLTGFVTTRGEITLPAIIGSNMVLQQKAEVPLWGKARPHATIRVTTSWDHVVVSAAAAAGPNAAGAAAGKVLAEVDAYARRHGGQAGTFAGLAGAGDLVATVIADGAGERVSAEALDALPLLAAALREDGADAPAVTGLADVVAGLVEPERWAATVMKPTRRRAA